MTCMATPNTLAYLYRVNVASLLVVVLTGRMEYLTEVLRLLLLKLVDKSVASKHPQLMLRRTETVVEKMLTNWLALCMYDYLKVSFTICKCLYINLYIYIVRLNVRVVYRLSYLLNYFLII